MSSTMANRFTLSDSMWERIQPLIPQPDRDPAKGGRPRADDRVCMNAIFFVLRTGCQWNALDATGICPSSTAHDRFQEWKDAGVFERIWLEGLTEYDELQGIDWRWVAVDGAMTKAPLGGEKTGKNPTDRGKSGVKRSLMTDAAGVPIAVVIDGANRHDLKLLAATLDDVKPPRPDPTQDQPHGLCLDKAYDAATAREAAAARGYTPHIRSRGEEAKAAREADDGAPDDDAKRPRRWVAERTHGWCHGYRGLLVRWMKDPENHLAMLHFAFGLLTLQRAGVFG